MAVEGDWPVAYRVNRYVRGRSQDATAEEALHSFARFPTWMWRNTVVLSFVGWLCEHNDRVRDERGKAAFDGLDLYSLYRSIHEVIASLDRVDPAASVRARDRYACFDHYGGDDGHAVEYARQEGLLGEDEFFYAEQNAKTVKDVAEFYRSMFSGRTSSWNLRDRHMVDTLHTLQGHLTRRLPRRTTRPRRGTPPRGPPPYIAESWGNAI